MPKSKFIIKHGCCYIPPLESESTSSSNESTMQVFQNLEFDKLAQSAVFCGMLKSAPEFNQNEKSAPWDCIDTILKVNSSSEAENHNKHCSQTQTDPVSFVTIYGYKKTDSPLTDLTITDSCVSDASVYQPATRKVSSSQMSRFDRLLDRLSMCLWKCSGWC